MPRRQLMVTVLCTCLLVSACTTMRTVPIAGAASNSDIAPGREATIVLRSGTEVIARIVSADATGLVVREGDRAEPYQIPFSDIQALSIRRISAKRTAGAVAGTLLAVFSAWYLKEVREHANDD